MRRLSVLLCTSRDPYHVPSLARVALFPLHLDPPTKQHREIFRLLLGAPDLTPSSTMPSSTTSQALSSSNGATAAKTGVAVTPPSSSSSPPELCSGSGSTPSSAVPSRSKAVVSRIAARAQKIFDRSPNVVTSPASPSPFHEPHVEKEGQHGCLFTGVSAPRPSTTTVPSPGISSFSDVDPVSCVTSSPYWYMEAFATSLREDSQLAPFDDIILIPNTRYPVSLRQSTHLAALAVLAARGLARVHVDFTALEHPDESMPIVYELICRYPNSVLVHWLHDAHEVLNWSHFADFKSTVPMLLLQTQSYPPKALERQRPVGDGSRLTSRQYHSPIGQYVRSPEEADYYRRAERFMSVASKYRQHNPTPMMVTASNPVDPECAIERRYESASLVDRESDYFDDIPDMPSPRRQHHEDVLESSTKASLAPDQVKVLARSPLLRGGGTTTRTASTSAPAPAAAGRVADLKTGLSRRASSSVHGEPGVSYANCARGRWWNTPGGRGDDEVEVSRSYWSSTSSSWLGGGAASYAALPDWMDVEGVTMADRAQGRRQRRRGSNVDDAATTAGPRGDSDVFGGGDYSGEGKPHPQDMDTIVSDDGFSFSVKASAGEGARACARRDNTTTDRAVDSPTAAEAVRRTGSTRSSIGAEVVVPTSPEGPEAVGENTRKRLLTREVEEVRAELRSTLRPTSAVAATPVSVTAVGRTTAGATAAASGYPFSHEAATATPGSRLGRSSGTRARPISRLLGVAGPHHEEHHPARRRHRTVRELIEELYPSRVHVSVGAANHASATSAATEAGVVHDNDHRRGGDVSAAASSLFSSSSHLRLNSSEGPQPSGAAMWSDYHDGSGDNHQSGDRGTSSVNGFSDIFSSQDTPMVEVHPVTRSTGADVRQALWEQEINPSFILTDCVQRYVEGHGLYRDPRKTTAASLYGSVGVSSDCGNGTRSGSGCSGGGTSGLGGSAGAAGQMSGADGGFRESAMTGVGGTGGIAGGTIGIRRVVAPRDTATLCFPSLIPRLELHYDCNNLLAREQYERLRIFQCLDGEEPDLIVPIGGDGYMMHCIRKNWRRFIPFYGVNAGHVGYLLNDRSTLEELFSSPLKLHFTTMLYCQAEKEGDTGERTLLSELAFNDAWVERSSGQTALIRILVNGRERIPQLRGDGVLVSTAAGSTAYSRALGASPVPVGAPLIQVVGSNVVSPAQWRPAHLDQEDQVEFEVIDSTKRPCRCYVDSVDVGNVTRLLVRSSRVAGVTLAFSKSCDLQHKLYQMQFPKTR
ncbi:hypothetical protein JKF63_07118 [Porcisia hertigi]|uniref:NAD(+) kinase n=1 Tax=Porcisia hertigi TaxID=2761500 RepID=A0A836LKJ4_9TRYP|nr:hypothetical protein JKF63_07118 [Porcisia hertigi]